ncbi:hypothetical protein EPUS_07890 [Endocarpon pusillum Z07020]|uniref:PH domain-containing protein n=1 Tax=Endocarpon pusillum (strain Z07020 / HMAS-L-300199) TaxID=1263415 RepID=U1G1T2_ENDPU|nr:uncharacterized protein EPUS_07890 [Endocarpon pusillum Z07020]ERF71207.1 hypothetical protein EPUS_07890 [Endocarpon pusillum Z07020]
MTTETQTIPQSHSTPTQKFSRYRSVRQAATTQAPPPPAVTQLSRHSQNESIQRSMSRYRKPSSKPAPFSSPPVPEPTAKPSRIPQSHSASLAALTGEPCPEDQESPSSTPSKYVPSRPRQYSSPRNATSPRKINALQDTPLTRRAPSTEEATQPRQLSWEAICDLRARPQPPPSSARREDCEMLVAENEHSTPVKARQSAERGAKLQKRRLVATEERKRLEDVRTKQQELNKTDYQAQEKARPSMVQQRDQQQGAASGRAAGARAAKKESLDLRRGDSVQQRLDSFTRNESALSPGNGSMQDPLASQKAREPLSKPRQSCDAPTSKPAPSNHNVPAPWVDAPVSKPAPSNHIVPAPWVDAPVSKPSVTQSYNGGPAQWIDAPISRPAPQQDGPVVVPQYDAPVSAVNAGERHVLVKCNASSLTLPVTPSTTPKDIIHSASLAMSEPIDSSRSKLVESFTQLGLERPLRNYEHVRDVMNSWDHDAQNSFIILPLGNDGHDDQLDLAVVPKQQPGDTSVYMYHSQRPKTWDKRWMTLRPDGQVTIAKRQGQETSNICHLTDFDIYTPTPGQQTKRIRPPRKLCFAIKSQQKSNMFLNGANFVHFFATGDRMVAKEWYKAVQGWRSWYLVNVLGEGQTSKRASMTTNSVRPATAKTQRRASIDAATYQAGSFKPAVDLDHDGLHLSDPSPAPRASRSADVFHARKTLSRDRAPPPSAFLNKLSKDAESGAPTTNHQRMPSIAKGPVPGEGHDSTFAPTGLLGRTYSQRQRAQRDREINGGRTRSMASVEPPTGLTRKASTKSVRQMPKPLIDLTPQYQEPPQHVKKGRAVIPEPGQQLVEVATGLELLPGAIMTPSATTWRRPQAQSPPRENLGRPRGKSMHTDRRSMTIDGNRPRPSMDTGRPQMNDHGGFLQGGLLARTQSKRAQGDRWTGHGVRTGDRNAADKPMIDLQSPNQFADGSLLRQLEAHAGGDEPVIDREKRREETVRVGEGV